ncbi:unnamed protein product [Coffea canephora]|uniref:Uncharacterized protein n=1 Tax=Coffea canephora TaxID=49390 RepID=A0A068UF37_COFCA|nr:unnamed protein product [Coffea canephora]
MPHQKYIDQFLSFGVKVDVINCSSLNFQFIEFSFNPLRKSIPGFIYSLFFFFIFKHPFVISSSFILCFSSCLDSNFSKRN